MGGFFIFMAELGGGGDDPPPPISGTSGGIIAPIVPVGTLPLGSIIAPNLSF